MVVVAGAVGLTGLATPVGAQASRPDGIYAHIYTAKGEIVARLRPDLVPMAVANFVGLAEGTIKNAAFDLGRPYFDGTAWPRVAPGHVIQSGPPASDRARGPGYEFPNQISALLSHDHAGALNYANGGPNTNAATWCITLGDRSYLDGDYIVFGNVVQGLPVVFSILQGDVMDSVRIERVGKEWQSYHPDTESFQAMRAAALKRLAEQDKKAAADDRAWLAEHYPDVTGPADGVRTKVLAPATGTRAPGTALRVRYWGTSVRYVGNWRDYDGPDLQVRSFGSDEQGVPGFHAPPQLFMDIPGETRINPGLDSVIAHMAPGERVVAVVPAELGYGRAGAYPPQIPGHPRFVISPNTLLVYQVEALGSDGLPAAGQAGVEPAPSGFDPEYTKYVDAEGIPILATSQASDSALLRVREIVNEMLAMRPDARAEMVAQGFRMVVMAPSEQTTDVPEESLWTVPAKNDWRLTAGERAHYDEPGGMGSMTAKQYWDRRARGMDDNPTTCAQENVLGDPSGRYYGENICVHEFAHAIMEYGLQFSDPELYGEIQDAYEAAMAEGLWKGQYASTNSKEYFAEAAQTWFWSNIEFYDGNRRVQSPDDLKAYDPRIWKLLSRIFSTHHLKGDVFYARNLKPARRPGGGSGS
jgi:cyclophilin family peptidyl-prolyl cis-trans isomerase